MGLFVSRLLLFHLVIILIFFNIFYFRRLQSGDDVSNNETYGCKAETTEIKKLTNNILENPVVYLKGVSSSNTIPLVMEFLFRQ